MPATAAVVAVESGPGSLAAIMGSTAVWLGDWSLTTLFFLLGLFVGTALSLR